MASTNKETFFRCYNYQDAKDKSFGYQDRKLVENLVEKNKNNPPWRMKNTDSYVDHRQLELCTALMWIICKNKFSDIKVSDVGGANGYLFFSCKRYIPNINWSWKVFESDKVALAYSQFEKESGIKWESSETELTENADVALFSCTLQYLEFPIKMLQKYALRHKYLIITRLPFVKGNNNVITVQNIVNFDEYQKSDISWPSWFFQKELFLQEINKIGSVIYHWKTPTEVLLFEGENIMLEGMLIRCH